MNHKIPNTGDSVDLEFDFRRLVPDAFKTIDIPVNSFPYIQDVFSERLYGELDPDTVPFLSVVIPTYQRSEFLQAAVCSVLQQKPTQRPWECLVVDNTPLDTDGTTPALDLIQTIQDPRVLYYHNQKNIGPGYNWNRGAELARGEWVVFLHDDDLLYEDALLNLERIIDTCPQKEKPLGYIQARRDVFSRPEELSSLERRGVRYFEPLTKTGALITGAARTGTPSCGTAILKKAYMDTGGVNYDYGLTADAILGYQIMEHYSVIVSDCSLGAYRWAENETLKRDTLLGLVRSDYLFAQYRYSRSLFARVWGKLFWRAEHNANVGYKIRDGHRKAIIMTPESFSEVVPYRRSSPLTVFLHKVIRKIYTVTMISLAKHQYPGK